MQIELIVKDMKFPLNEIGKQKMPLFRAAFFKFFFR